MLVDIYNSFPPEVWIALGAPIIVIVVNRLKKLLGDAKMDLTIHAMTVTTSFLVTYLPTVITHTAKPLPLLGAYTAGFFMAANILYAISKALKALLAFYNSQKAAKALAAASAPTEKVVAPAASVSSSDASRDW